MPIAAKLRWSGVYKDIFRFSAIYAPNPFKIKASQESPQTLINQGSFLLITRKPATI